MSDSNARSVSWITVAVVFAGFALFYAVVNELYHPRPAALPYNVPAEQLPADQAWQATPEARKAYRTELQKEQSAQAAKYAWIDQAKGSVQLPIDRAMELTIRDLNARAKR
jgi:broad specificity polyphosphatase/5'/3'-nucleotidase SurE